MREQFNNFTTWFWPFLGNIFTTIGEFISGTLTSLSSNQSDIVTVIGYLAFTAITLFVLKKLLDFMVGYFSSFTKDDIKNKAKKVSLYSILMLLLASFISFQMGSVSCH
jgi:hypothetical protein